MSIKFNNLFLISILFHLLIAVSAPPFIFELEQSDGQKIPVKLFGHEYYNWMETQDGYVVDWVDDGDFRGLYYSVLDNDGKFINSEIFVTYPAPIDIDIAKHLRERDPQVRDLSYKKLHSKKFHKHLNRGSSNQFKPLVMLVDFPDVPKTYSKQNFSDLLFRQNLSPELANFPPGHEEYNMSVRDYFDEVSNGKLRFTGDLESISDWQRADNDYSYYVDGSNGTAQGQHGWSQSAAALVVETAMKMDGEGFDFSNFDNGNGAVDIVILVVSGRGGDKTGDYFWPHMFIVPQLGNGLEQITSNPSVNNDDYFSLDGVVINKYIVIQEKYAWSHSGSSIDNLHPIGTICHELGHALGLPDLYDTSEFGAEGIGEWGLMGSGNWNNQTSPAYLSAWSRYSLGFIDPVIIDNEINTSITINPAESAQDSVALLLPLDSNMPHEYILLENRQKIGADIHLPESGMLAWHIDENITNLYPALNDVNVNPDFFGVNLLQPDMLEELYSNDCDISFSTNTCADNGDVYPRSYSNSITDNTIPNTKTYGYDRDADGNLDNAIDSEIEITDIVETNELIHLNITNPNIQGRIINYDEGGFEGIAFPKQAALSWVGIRVKPEAWLDYELNDTMLLSGVQIVLPSISQATDYVLKIWKGWSSNKPQEVIHYYEGNIDWSYNDNRDMGWVYISLINENIKWIEDDYYIEININGDNPYYYFDQGLYSNNASSGESYYRSASNDICLPLSSIPSAGNGDWNIRAVLSTEKDVDYMSSPNLIVPNKHTFFSNYPNPFNPITTIPVDLYKPGVLSYKVFDLNGREIFIENSERLNAGYHEFKLNLTNFSSGVYFYQFSIDAIEYPPQKIVLLK